MPPPDKIELVLADMYLSGMSCIFYNEIRDWVEREGEQ